MLTRIISLFVCFLLTFSAHASWKHKGHKPKIFKNCYEDNDALIVYTPEWFDSVHESGVYVFGRILNPGPKARVLVQGHSAEVDSLGNYFSKVSIGHHRKALPIKVELQHKKHNKWKTIERDITVVKIDRNHQLLEPIAGLSCFQVNPNSDYLINCTASSSIDLDGALRDFFWLVNDGEKILRGENVIFDAGSDVNQNITLVAIDDDGLHGIASTSVEVAPLNTAPTINITLSSNEGVVPTTLSANANVTDSENNLQTIRWSASNGQHAEGSAFSVNVDIPGPLTLTVVATDSLGAQSKEVIVFTGKAPIIPDPVLLAPETKQNETTEFKDTVAFLYSGSNPIQKSVIPGTIKEDKLAVVTGRVLDTSGQPISGAKVSLNQQGGFGHTFTRADGKFDLAVNAGTYTLKYQNAGYISSQRDFTVGVGGYKQEEDIVLVKLSPNVTPIDMASPVAQLAVGESVSDVRGDRTHVLITAPQTTATAILPDGTEQQLPITSIRITEFTQGEDGPKRMPADLPSATAYTLAANFHVDEAAAIGAETVTFNKPVFYYVDNFLSAPAGSAVPLATYDEKCGAWVPGKDGYIIDILGIDNGYAQIDANGDGIIDDQDILSQYGVSSEELELLASRYVTGDSIARYELYHFSNVDANYSQGTNSSGNSPNVSGTGSHNNSGTGNSACGSILNLQDCSLGEVIDLVGTELKLFYNSKFDANNKNGLEFEISLSGDEIDAKSIRLRYNVSGQNFEYNFQAQPNLKHKITWDGKNKYGKSVFGSVPVDVEVTYLYDSFYRYFEYNDLVTFGSTPWQDLQPGETIPAPDFEVSKNFRVYLSNQFHKPVGNMFLSDHHFYDPGQRRIFYGNGTQSNIAEKSKVTVKPFDKFFGATAKHPITGEIYFTKYFDEQGNYNRTCIQKMTANGDIVLVAGRAPCYETSNDTPTQRYPDKDLTKFVYINKMMFDEKGNLYFNDVGANILYRFNEASGSLERIAGTGLYPNVVSDDTFYDYIDQEAYEADFPFYSFTLGQQGWVYISTYSGVYMINPCADEYKLRGYWYNPFFMPKYLENINMDKATGTLYYGNGLDSLNPNGPGVAWMHLGYIRPDGVSGYLSRIGTNPFCGFNQPCGIEPPRRFMEDVTVDGYVQLLLDDGSILTTSSFHTNFDFSQGISGAVVRRMPTGEIETLVGGGEIPTDQNFTSPVDGADLRIPWSMESLIELDDGNILVTTWNGYKSFSFKLPRPENQTQVNEHRVADSARNEIYLFDKKGRHLKTFDLMTEALKWEFSYNSQGDIISAKDRNGLVTTIERDNDGQPTAIIAPLGQRTELSVQNGQVVAVSNPAANTWTLGYGSSELLESFVNPRGLASIFEYNDKFDLIADTNAKGGRATLVKEQDDANRFAYTFSSTEGVLQSFESNFQDAGHVASDRKANRLTPTLTTHYRDTVYTREPRRAMSERHSLDPHSNYNNSYTSSRVVEINDAVQPILGYTFLENRQLELDGETVIAKNKFFTKRGAFTLLEQNWSERYEVLTRSLTKTSAENRTSIVEFDDKGREVSSTAPGVATIEMSYNSIGKLDNMLQGDRLTSFDYDVRGRVIRSVDPIGQVWLYDWDDADRLIFEQDPAGDQTRYSYDQAGNRTSIQLPGGRFHQFSFDVLDMEEVYTPPTIGQNTNIQTLFDKDRRLEKAIYPTGENISYERIAEIGGNPTPIDNVKTINHSLADGRLRSTSFGFDHEDTGLATNVIMNEQSSDTIALEYSYLGDLKSEELLSFNGIEHGKLAWTFDDFLRPTTLKIDAANKSATASMIYDRDNILTGLGPQSITRESNSGRVSNVNLDQVSQNWSYNEYGEVMSLNASSSAGLVFNEQILERDGLGRITKKSETDSFGTSEYNYLYDLKGQLIQVERDGAIVASYNYDIRGNRLSSLALQQPATYDAQDRLLSDGKFSYSYDANGSLAGKTEISTGEETKFFYDGLSNLKKVELADGRIIEYLIDGRNRRVGKKIDGVLKTTWLYQDQLNPVAQIDYDASANANPTFFFYGTKSHVPDYAIKDEIRYTIISDHLGSVRQVINSQTGVIVQAQSFDAFGNLENQSGDMLVPFGFAGGLSDQDTGLIRFGARDYDSQTGRWTSKDPIKFDGDGLNIYRYVNNDPVNLIDPEGLEGMSNEDANQIIDDARDRYDTTLDALQDMGESENGNDVLDEAWRGVEEAQVRCATN